eukprot:10902785-Heterocapsa_arctica.AAC.1
MLSFIVPPCAGARTVALTWLAERGWPAASNTNCVPRLLGYAARTASGACFSHSQSYAVPGSRSSAASRGACGMRSLDAILAT